MAVDFQGIRPFRPGCQAILHWAGLLGLVGTKQFRNEADLYCLNL